MPGVFISSTIICFMKCHSKAIRKTWLFNVLFFKKSYCIFWVKNAKTLRARFSAEASEPSPTEIDLHALHTWPEAFKMQFLGFCTPLPAILAFCLQMIISNCPTQRCAPAAQARPVLHGLAPEHHSSSAGERFSPRGTSTRISSRRDGSTGGLGCKALPDITHLQLWQMGFLQ